MDVPKRALSTKTLERGRARLQAGDHAVERVGIDGVRAALLLAQAQDGRHGQHGFGDRAVRRAALQLAQPQQQLRQRACARAPDRQIRQCLCGKLAQRLNVATCKVG
jgi:hypothetical protein